MRWSHVSRALQPPPLLCRRLVVGCIGPSVWLGFACSIMISVCSFICFMHYCSFRRFFCRFCQRLSCSVSFVGETHILQYPSRFCMRTFSTLCFVNVCECSYFIRFHFAKHLTTHFLLHLHLCVVLLSFSMRFTSATCKICVCCRRKRSGSSAFCTYARNISRRMRFCQVETAPIRRVLCVGIYTYTYMTNVCHHQCVQCIM